MNRRLNILAVNLNSEASVRRGIKYIMRVLTRRFSVNMSERHFARVNQRDIIQADAIILGPQGTPFDAYGTRYSTLLQVISETKNRPTLGICGGCQAMVIANDGRIGPLSGGHATHTYTGLEKHSGWRTIRSIKEDPLLPNGTTASVHVSHVEATTKLPSQYEHIATSDYCDIQMIRDRNRPHWGVQFHPEYGRDGFILLERFMRAVRTL